MILSLVILNWDLRLVYYICSDLGTGLVDIFTIILNHILTRYIIFSYFTCLSPCVGVHYTFINFNVD